MEATNRSSLLLEKNFYNYHILICGLGLLGLLLTLSNNISSFLYYKLNMNLVYLPWAESILSTDKLTRLIQYGVSLVGLFVYYLGFLYVFRNLSGYFPLLTRLTVARKNIYLILLLSANLTIFISTIKLGVKLNWVISCLVFFIGCFWIGLFSAPFLWAYSKQAQAQQIKPRWGIAILCFLLLQLIIQFYPYIFEKPRIANDFLDVSETTLLKSGPVDNTDFINQHNIWGMTKYDPRQNFKKNIENYPRDKLLKITPNLAVTAYIKNHPYQYGYLPGTSSLLIAIDAHSSLKDYKDFIALFSPQEQLKITAYIESQIYQKENFPGYSASEQEFIEKNKVEVANQILIGHYFYHQYTILGPLNQYNLGESARHIDFLYGWYNAIIINKLVHFMGGLNFQNYTKALYVFYPLYYFIFILIAYLIFKDLWTTVLVSVLSLASLQLMGFEYTHYAPGFNPIRHFLDASMLLGLYYYLKSNKNKTIKLILLFSLSLFSVVLSREFGLFLFLSLWAFVFFFEFIKEKNKFLTGLVLFVSIIGVALIWRALPSSGTAESSTQMYMLLGVGVAATPRTVLLLCLLTISMVYYFLLFCVREKNIETKLTWFLFFYAQASFVYFMWYFEPGHLFCMGSALVLFLVLLGRQIFATIQTKKYDYRWVVCLFAIALLILLYIPSLAAYYYNQYQYNTIFSTHKVYDWNFKMAQFETTMDPAPFQRAIELIQKYVPDQNNIYIISKYNTLLPFLAGKYSALPMQDILTALITQKEILEVKTLILQDKPKYLFIDSDINWIRQGDVINKTELLPPASDAYMKSYNRVEVLDSLTKLFNQISKNYVQVEDGGLITVYERKKL